MPVTDNFQSSLAIAVSMMNQFIVNFQDNMTAFAAEGNTYLDTVQLANLTNASHRAYAATRFLAGVDRYKQLNTGDATLFRVLDDIMVQLICERADITTIQAFSLAQRTFQD
jgi:hypothetical protein